VAPIVEEAARLLRATVPAGIELVLDLDPQAPTVRVDPTRLHQVVINLGTNDFAGGDPGTAFVNAMKALIAQVRLHYPNAEIVVTSSPMLDGSNHSLEASYLQSAVSASGAHVSYLDIPTQNPVNGYGCDWHPSGTTQQLMATTLASHLHALLGW
jgi:lysophospholipase L1-like esterase